jgi:CO dehydrogenase maturation factor
MCDDCGAHGSNEAEPKVNMKTDSNGKTPIIAVCGKGGVGKTVISALVSKVLIDRGLNPVLVVDADPAGGLVSVIGERSANTLADVRDNIISRAGKMAKAEREQLADQIDYLLHEALIERQDYTLLAMGLSSKKGCYCPVNRLLREAIELIGNEYAAVIVDAEAGIEQINRQVTKDVTHVIGVVDGSIRSLETLEVIKKMVTKADVYPVINRYSDIEQSNISDIDFAGEIPEDETLRTFDRQGKSLWDLPGENKAYREVESLIQNLGILEEMPA